MSLLKEEKARKCLELIKGFHDAVEGGGLSDDVKKRKEEAVMAVEQLEKMLLTKENDVLLCTPTIPTNFSKYAGVYEG
ncbi:MAG: hypothetical protein GY765_10210 [bacterium]|nr:hypothetical protein [bacterium]